MPQLLPRVHIQARANGDAIRIEPRHAYAKTATCPTFSAQPGQLDTGALSTWLRTQRNIATAERNALRHHTREAHDPHISAPSYQRWPRPCPAPPPTAGPKPSPSTSARPPGRRRRRAASQHLAAERGRQAPRREGPRRRVDFLAKPQVADDRQPPPPAPDDPKSPSGSPPEGGSLTACRGRFGQTMVPWIISEMPATPSRTIAVARVKTGASGRVT